MPTLIRILALIRKELLAILREPRSRVVVILPPIIQTFLFGYALSFELNEVPYALLDEDRTAASRAMVAHIEGSGIFRRVADVPPGRDFKPLIDDRRAMLVVRIGGDFERRVSAGQPAAVQVISDGRNSNTAGIAVSYVAAAVGAFNADWRAAHAQPPAAVEVIARTWYNPNLITRWNMVPALVGTLTLLSTLLLTALSVAREREQGTFDQLMVTPFTPLEIMIGKALPSILIGLVQATAILLVAQWWFKIPFAGSFVTLYCGLGLFLMAAVGIGLFVSSLVVTMQQAMLFSFVLIMPFTLLSGLVTPIANMPRAMQIATMINPLRYAIELAQRVYLEGAGFHRLMYLLWPLAVIGVISLSVSAWFFRHRLK